MKLVSLRTGPLICCALKPKNALGKTLGVDALETFTVSLSDDVSVGLAPRNDHATNGIANIRGRNNLKVAWRNMDWVSGLCKYNHVPCLSIRATDYL